ncbi:septation protein SepH [Pseudonocardia spinosispora]|uniref:septation protein SepH n=1 Tax=Pseudonocardia spinosispora TaxID=103441 RepID=UPI00041FE174|nr:septation protein SepH [Pseudonocardia spinosispora]
MRALRVVGYDEEGVVILEDPDRRERFTVPADERLRAAARGDVQRLGQMSMELESQLRPREIQARIRAGASVEQVAAAAGVTHQRIERFAYPVLLERSQIAGMARDAHPVRDDGPDLRTLGEVVAHTFGLRGQEYTEAEWDAWRGEDHKWVVTLSWKVGRSDITARWGYHPGSHGGTVSALNEHAVDLVDGQVSRLPRRVGPVVDFNKSDADGTEEPVEEPRVAPSDPKRATGTDAGRRATKTTTGRGATSGKTESAAEDDSPAKRGGRKTKPVMPSWEDVLLGVKSQRN